MNSDESGELVDLAERSGLVNAVTFNVRFYPLLQHARALIRRGALGTIYAVHGATAGLAAARHRLQLAR